MTRRAPTALAALLLACAQPDAAGATSVVELFTSQGCSSCPPADKVLAELARKPDVIALSLPVDYWDYLGWKDTFAKPAFTQRQRAYASQRGDGEIYTPQAVVNGRTHCNGASRADIAAAMATTAASVDVPVTLTRSADGVTLTIGAAPQGAARSGRIIVMPYLAARDVSIGRGENARRTVTYTNIVRELVPLADWKGAPASFSIPADRIAEADGLAVIIQGEPGHASGAILGAAQLALR